MTETDLPPGEDDRLESWKEIASYLNRGVSTVQRWEREEGLPVHRHEHAKKGSIYAFRGEIDSWRVTRSAMGPALESAPDSPDPEAPASTGFPKQGENRLRAALFIGVVVGITIAAVWFVRLQTRAPSSSAEETVGQGFEGELEPHLSPDGQAVAFLAPDSSLMVRPIAGGTAHRVVAPHKHGVNCCAEWSPTGGEIAFLRERDPAVRELFVLNIESSIVRKLTATRGYHFEWSPDGGALAVIDRQDDHHPFFVRLVDASTGRDRGFRTTPSASIAGDFLCAFGPDGKTLAIARFTTATEGTLKEVSLSDGAIRPLTSEPVNITGIVWSKRGSRIVYAVSSETSYRILALSPRALDRSTEVIAEGLGMAHYLSLGEAAAGDERLAFQRSSYGTHIRAWELNSTKQATIAPANAVNMHPAVSPDGRAIAFSSDRTGAFELWLDTGDDEARQLTYRGGSALWPAWSPDSRDIAFIVGPERQRDVLVMNVENRSTRRITKKPGRYQNPAWAPSRDWIYFSEESGDGPNIWRAPAEGGEQELVMTKGGMRVAVSLDNRLFFTRSASERGLWGLSPDGVPRLAVPRVVQTGWALSDQGIIYIDFDVTDRRVHPTLRRLDVYSGQTTEIGVLPAEARRIHGNLAIGKDGRRLAWSQIVRFRSEINTLELKSSR